jgi:hypothetical protein
VILGERITPLAAHRGSFTSSSVILCDPPPAVLTWTDSPTETSKTCPRWDSFM